jgi:hypothetical protein
MARFRARQQEEAHNPSRRGVPAPLPAPSAAARLRAHPQLRIPRQPQPRFAPAAVLPTPQRPREDHCFAGITVRPSDPLELPGLRRNHARRRTVHRRPTPAPLAASTRPARSMKRYPHPQPLPVLRRVRRLLVSSVLGCSPGCLFSPPLTLHRGVSPHHRTVKAAHPTQLSRCLIPPHPLKPIQSA